MNLQQRAYEIADHFEAYNKADVAFVLAKLQEIAAAEREACLAAVKAADAECDGPCECPAHGRYEAAIRARGNG